MIEANDEAYDSPGGKHLPPAFALAAFRAACWLVSAAVLAFVTVCYTWRPDRCTFVTLFPPWCWTVGGFGLVWMGHSIRHRWRSGLLVAGWLLFLITVADTPTSLVRPLVRPADEEKAIRVISLNCAGESSAALDVARLRPDIILFQESPTTDTLAALATKMFGSSANFVRSYDPSIVARGKVTSVPIPHEYFQNFVHARVEIDSHMINVISLRLSPCPVNFEFWSADCWRYYQTNRENRRRQLATIADYAKTLPADEPLILGGDFNCPPGDAVLELLQPWLADAFMQAGRGWGATIIEFAGLPLIRIDQIWTNSSLRPVSAFAARTDGSDHHMTVADFDFAARQD